MDKKGFLPLIVLIPLILVGIIASYFIIAELSKMVIKITLWIAIIAFSIGGIYLIWLIFSAFNKGDSKKRLKQCFKGVCKNGSY